MNASLSAERLKDAAEIVAQMEPCEEQETLTAALDLAARMEKLKEELVALCVELNSSGAHGSTYVAAGARTCVSRLIAAMEPTR